MLGYLSLDIICSSKLTVFSELRSRKTIFRPQLRLSDLSCAFQGLVGFSRRHSCLSVLSCVFQALVVFFRTQLCLSDLSFLSEILAVFFFMPWVRYLGLSCVCQTL